MLPELSPNQQKILIILEKEKQIRTTHLRKQMDTSMKTLSAELKRLEKDQMIKRIVDTSARPPRVYYRLPNKSLQLQLSNVFVNQHFSWLSKKQDKKDGSWQETKLKLKNNSAIKQQKIIYTNQVLRTYCEADKHNNSTNQGVSFLEKTTIKDEQYDHVLRFHPLHCYKKTELAKEITDEIAFNMRKSGMSESQRYLSFWFALLSKMDILNTMSYNDYENELHKIASILLRNEDNESWDDNPSITSWVLSMLKKTGHIHLLKNKGRNSIAFIHEKLNGSKWELDFQTSQNTLTPEIESAIITNSHILNNMCDLVDLMTEDQINDCIKKPFRWIKKQSKHNYFTGKTNKPDSYVTALALRTLIKTSKTTA